MTEANTAAGPLVSLQFVLNGAPVTVEVDPRETLFDTLRERLRSTGTKGACLEGECGSCTILLDGAPVTACLVMALQVEGRDVVTVEGLAEGEQLSALQSAFVRAGAVQCGYCTPGLLVAATALLRNNPRPSEADVRRGLAGNLCRCTGYGKIVEAVLDASRGSEEASETGSARASGGRA